MARPKKEQGEDSQQEQTPTFASRVYEDYFTWTREADKSSVIKRWLLIAVLSAVAITVATLIPFGGNWVKAIIAFPAAVGVYAIAYGILERRAALGTKPHPKDAYSPRKRRTIGLIAVAVILVSAFVMSNYLPYALGGSLIVGACLFFYDFIRLTPGELEVQKAGLVDVRELAEAGLTPEDVVPEDATWSWGEEGDWDDIEGGDDYEDGLPTNPTAKV